MTERRVGPQVDATPARLPGPVTLKGIHGSVARLDPDVAFDGVAERFADFRHAAHRFIDRCRGVEHAQFFGAVHLEGVEAAARSGENLMPPIIAAVEAYATLGEIADKMRVVFGEYTEVS